MGAQPAGASPAAPSAAPGATAPATPVTPAAASVVSTPPAGTVAQPAAGTTPSGYPAAGYPAAATTTPTASAAGAAPYPGYQYPAPYGQQAAAAYPGYAYPSFPFTAPMRRVTAPPPSSKACQRASPSPWLPLTAPYHEYSVSGYFCLSRHLTLQAPHWQASLMSLFFVRARACSTRPRSLAA